MAEHYDTTILPTRSRKPGDKGKVEGAVLIVERWILARLRNRTFFSLAELNSAIAELLEELNNRPMRHVGKSRRELFEEIERAALRPLPATPFEYAEWRSAKVTVNAHMPKAHQRYANTTLATLIARAAKIGPNAAILVERLMRDRPHPEQGYRAAMGILSLSPRYGQERTEAACERALTINAITYASVTAIGEETSYWPTRATTAMPSGRPSERPGPTSRRRPTGRVRSFSRAGSIGSGISSRGSSTGSNSSEASQPDTISARKTTSPP